MNVVAADNNEVLVLLVHAAWKQNMTSTYLFSFRGCKTFEDLIGKMMMLLGTYVGPLFTCLGWL